MALTLPILYEDEHLLVVDKPSGVFVHADSGVLTEETVADWVARTYPAIKGVGEPMRLRDGTEIDRPGIVHRLDKETSGALIIAKHQDSFDHLKHQFKTGAIEKTYHAVLNGVPGERDGIIDRPIGRSAKDFRLRSAQRGARGTLRDAVTEYTVLGENGKYAYVEAHPKTGRTHQIRVHFKAIHHPVVCDRLYGPARVHGADGAEQPCALGFTRLALHAHTLSFKNIDGTPVFVSSPLPEVFVEAAETLGV